MGVYIPNMNKPKECKECQWHLDFYIEDKQVGGLCTITEKDDKENTCPLIEIPTPHGRLIDADKLRATLRRWTEDEWNQKASPVSWAYAYEDLIDLIDDAPTILDKERE